MSLRTVKQEAYADSSDTRRVKEEHIIKKIVSELLFVQQYLVQLNSFTLSSLSSYKM